MHSCAGRVARRVGATAAALGLALAVLAACTERAPDTPPAPSPSTSAPQSQVGVGVTEARSIQVDGLTGTYLLHVPVTRAAGPVTTDAASCLDGREVTFITIADAPADALDATATIWAFFAAH